MKCQHCGAKDNLIKIGVSTNGKQRFLCCKCNTEKSKRYRQTEKGKENFYNGIYKSIKKYPERQKARLLLNYHVKSGKIHKPILCEGCGEEKQLFAHHHDYSKPLEVNWYCMGCHRQAHKGCSILK